jgi:O-acetyl-ADP-ribose deacetylase (regulator of RNase III)
VGFLLDITILFCYLLIMKITTMFADITELGVDVIVNAANEAMAGGGGVDGAIHRAAGPELVKETIKAAPLYVSKTLLTSGYNLKARHIVHTVGPRYYAGYSGEYVALEMCYRNVIRDADRVSARIMAIPAISAGVYGFPAERAAKIAVETSFEELHKCSNLEEIMLVAYDNSTLKLYKKYIDAHK